MFIPKLRGENLADQPVVEVITIIISGQKRKEGMKSQKIKRQKGAKVYQKKSQFYIGCFWEIEGWC